MFDWIWDKIVMGIYYSFFGRPEGEGKTYEVDVYAINGIQLRKGLLKSWEKALGDGYNECFEEFMRDDHVEVARVDGTLIAAVRKHFTREKGFRLVVTDITEQVNKENFRQDILADLRDQRLNNKDLDAEQQMEIDGKIRELENHWRNMTFSDIMGFQFAQVPSAKKLGLWD